MTLSPDQFKKNQANVEEGKYRAAVARVQAGPEVAAKSDALTADVPNRLRRMFSGTPLDKKEAAKGRWDPYHATEEEYTEYRAKHPATHHWETLK